MRRQAPPASPSAALRDEKLRNSLTMALRRFAYFSRALRGLVSQKMLRLPRTTRRARFTRFHGSQRRIFRFWRLKHLIHSYIVGYTSFHPGYYTVKEASIGNHNCIKVS